MSTEIATAVAAAGECFVRIRAPVLCSCTSCMSSSLVVHCSSSLLATGLPARRGIRRASRAFDITAVDKRTSPSADLESQTFYLHNLARITLAGDKLPLARNQSPDVSSPCCRRNRTPKRRPAPDEGGAALRARPLAQSDEFSRPPQKPHPAAQVVLPRCLRRTIKKRSTKTTEKTNNRAARAPGAHSAAT